MDEPSRDPQLPTVADRMHEESDVAIRPLAVFLAGLVVSLMLVSVLTAWLFGWFFRHVNAQPAVRSGATAPEEGIAAPILQVSPWRDLREFQAREQRILTSTEWIDREQGIVRIPIERAIQVVAEQGFPDWPQMDVAPQSNSGQVSDTPANR